MIGSAVNRLPPRVAGLHSAPRYPPPRHHGAPRRRRRVQCFLRCAPNVLCACLCSLVCAPQGKRTKKVRHASLRLRSASPFPALTAATCAACLQVGICGKYGTRYGASLRKVVKKIEVTQHAKVRLRAALRP